MPAPAQNGATASLRAADVSRNAWWLMRGRACMPVAPESLARCLSSGVPISGACSTRSSGSCPGGSEPAKESVEKDMESAGTRAWRRKRNTRKAGGGGGKLSRSAPSARGSFSVFSQRAIINCSLSTRGEAMSLRLGDTAPDFVQDSSEGTIRFHEWLGDSWGVLFSYPADFTPVCTTELGLTAKLKDEFEKRNVKTIALSVDNAQSHNEWIKDINETQAANVGFPILADGDCKVSTLYDMIHPNANETLTVRSLFVIDPNKKVRLIITYPASTGRNFDEVLRVIDSLQLTANYSVATPVNWKEGEDVIIVPAVSDEDAKAKFPKGWKTLKPYLRVTPQPNK